MAQRNKAKERSKRTRRIQAPKQGNQEENRQTPQERSSSCSNPPQTRMGATEPQDSSYRCDNLSTVHQSIVVAEDDDAIHVVCTICGEHGRLGKDTKGNPLNRDYQEWFKRDVLQPMTPLFYKYNEKYLSVL